MRREAADELLPALEADRTTTSAPAAALTDIVAQMVRLKTGIVCKSLQWGL